MQQPSVVLTSLRAATMRSGADPYGLIEDAAIVLAGGKIAWLGMQAHLPGDYAALPVRDMGGRLITPALIDCHTHVVHGGNRATEFEMRLQGASYEEVARAGGGIVSTVTATRKASEDDLAAAALPFVDAMIAEGVAVIEIKSGYGLEQDTELRMLRAARRIGQLRPVLVRTSYLAAHAVPVEYKGRADAYIDQVCIPALYSAHVEGLVDAVDGFCEGIAFSVAQIERVFQAAQSLGLPVKLHAEQLSNLGGAALAARYGAMSADHLEYLDEAGAVAMAASGTVAVILPGAFYTLRETRMPPIDLLRQHGVLMTKLSVSDSVSRDRDFMQRRSVSRRMEERPLLTPDEVRRLNPDLAILIPERQNPLLVHRIVYFQDPTFKKLFEAQKGALPYPPKEAADVQVLTQRMEALERRLAERMVVDFVRAEPEPKLAAEIAAREETVRQAESAAVDIQASGLAEQAARTVAPQVHLDFLKPPKTISLARMNKFTLKLQEQET